MTERTPAEARDALWVQKLQERGVAPSIVMAIQAEILEEQGKSYQDEVARAVKNDQQAESS